MDFHARVQLRSQGTLSSFEIAHTEKKAEMIMWAARWGIGNNESNNGNSEFGNNESIH